MCEKYFTLSEKGKLKYKTHQAEGSSFFLGARSVMHFGVFFINQKPFYK
jgi:hypothetical protein